MKQFHRIYHFIRHQLTAFQSGGHGVHSPYLFDFILNIVNEKHPYYCFEKIENIRRDLLNDQRTLKGTGNNRLTSIAAIASKALKPSRQAQMLFRICAHYRYRKVLELGTSLGITTLYLAAADKNIRCVSAEGSPELVAKAEQIHLAAGASNIQLETINLDTHLTCLLHEAGIQDLIFIDANHQYEALKNYFSQCVNFIHTNSIIVVDDPYWSEGMTRAWREIKTHSRVTATIDLYHMGIVFFNPELGRRHYRVRL